MCILSTWHCITLPALPLQEFMILPTGASTFEESVQIGCEVYHTLKTVIKGKYGQVRGSGGIVA